MADLGDLCNEMKKIYFRVSEETSEPTLVILILYTSQQNLWVYSDLPSVFLFWSFLYSRDKIASGHNSSDYFLTWSSENKNDSFNKHSILFFIFFIYINRSAFFLTVMLKLDKIRQNLHRRETSVMKLTKWAPLWKYHVFSVSI